MPVACAWRPVTYWSMWVRVRRGRGGTGCREGVAHRHELRRRLGDLGLGVGPRDDAAPGEQPDPRRVVDRHRATAQRDAPLAVTRGVDPADRPGVAPAVHVLELADHGVGHGRRRAAHRRRRVQRRRQGQRRRVVDEHPGHVGREVHDVRQVQHERRLGHVHRRAVRRQGVGHRAHGVLVLLEVLRRARERRGEREVVVVVAGAPDGAREHPRRHQPLLAAAPAARASPPRARRRRTPRSCGTARPAGAAATARRAAPRSSRRGRGPARPCRAARR